MFYSFISVKSISFNIRILHKTKWKNILIQKYGLNEKLFDNFFLKIINILMYWLYTYSSLRPNY